MKRLLFFFFVAGVMGFSPLRAQRQVPVEVQRVLQQRGEVYFKFVSAGRQQLQQLGRYISVDHRKKDTVFAYANAKGFAKFLQTGTGFVLLVPPSMRMPRQKFLPQTFKEANVENWNFYPSYGQYVKIMHDFGENYPELCKIVSIGKTVQGRELLFAHIGHPNDTTNSSPQFMYTSTMHGDETTGYILMLHLIDYMLSNYGKEAEVTRLMDSVDIWINPLANPDGTYAGGDTSVYGATRFNANHIDLNRNYPDPKAGEHPDGNAWQPETKAFINFAQEHNFVLSCNMHTGSEVANYPWDTWSFRTADDAWWQLVCRQYADTVHFYSRAGYMTELNNGITDGYDWYSITGGRQDYMNYFRHDREFTLELSDNKMPAPDGLSSYWEYNYRSLLNYMHQVLEGLRGTVTDSITGKPLKAEVFALNHDNHHSEVYSDSVGGCYFRPVFQGVYDFSYSASGYKTKVIQNVQIENGKLFRVDVQLVPDSPTGMVKYTKSDIRVYPNPAHNKLFCTGLEEDIPAVVMDMSGKVVFSQRTGPHEPLDISHLPQGIYFVKITAGKKIVFEKFVKR